MTDIQTIVDNRLKAPHAFFKWTKTFFPRYEWANKQDEILSTNRTKHTGLRTLPTPMALVLERRYPLALK